MAADSTPARARGDRLTHRRGVAFGVAAASVVAVIAAPLGALALSGGAPSAEAGSAVSAQAAAQAQAPAPAEAEGVRLHLAPATSTTIDPRAPLTVQVELDNATAEELAAGTLRLTRAEDPIDDAEELDAWLGSGSAAGTEAAAPPPTLELATADTRATTAGGSTTVTFTVPANVLGDPTAPVIGLGAELVVDGTVVATGSDAFATPAGTTGAKTTVALVYPLTVPEQTTGMIDAATLEEWTAPLGLLGRQLDAVADRPVAIGIDPRIIASIRALGSAAPESATAWLARLGTVTNEIFPLAYADADVALQAQLGLTTMLAPTSFSDVLDPSAFTTPVEPEPGTDPEPGEGEGDDEGTGEDGQAPIDEPTPSTDETVPATLPSTPEPTAGPTDTPSPTPTETPVVPGEVPSTEALLDWPYTRTDLAWPADDTVAAGDLGRLDAAGLTTTILAPGNVAPIGGAAPATASIDGSTALVADARLTEPLRAASSADSDTEWRSSTGQLLAEFAVAPSAGGAAVLATFDRDAGEHSTRVAATLDQLTRDAAVQPTGLAGAIGTPPVPRTLVDEPEDQQRTTTAQRMLDLEAQVGEFSSVLDDPRLLTGPVRRDLLALLDVAWLDDPVAWDAAAAQWLADRRATLAGVSVVPSSSVNIFTRESPLPVTVLNALPYPVTVVVSADPSNGRLVVEENVTQTIPAESRGTALVPIAAGVGRGEVTIAISLASPTGVAIGRTVFISGNVQADWEGLGAVILATAVVLFFGFGIWRNIRRRRKQRAAEAAEAAEPVEPVTDHEPVNDGTDASANGGADGDRPAAADADDDAAPEAAIDVADPSESTRSATDTDSDPDQEAPQRD